MPDEMFKKIGISLEEELETALRKSLLAQLQEEIKTEIEAMSSEQQMETLAKLISLKPPIEELKKEEPIVESEPQPEVKSLAQRIMQKFRGKKD